MSSFRSKSSPKAVSAKKTDIAGPDLYLSEDKKHKKDKDEMYEDVINNPQHYHRPAGPVTKSEDISFSSHGQWSLNKNEHRDATRGYQDTEYRPSELATDNDGPRGAMKGEANEMNMDNKIKTHGAIMAGGTNAIVSKDDKLSGGVGDKTKPSDVDPKQLKMGIKHEMEHTDDSKVAEEIALDHLTEDPQYYTKLNTIEKISFSKCGQWSLTKTPKIDAGLDRGQKVRARQARGKPTQRTNVSSETKPFLTKPMVQWKRNMAIDAAQERRKKEQLIGPPHPKALP